MELSCHGGLYLLRRVLRSVIAAGAVAAQAGEFTRRAFVNGKMDLTGAEAVMELIAAQGDLGGPHRAGGPGRAAVPAAGKGEGRAGGAGGGLRRLCGLSG